MLDYVNFLPWREILVKSKEFIALLKRNISLTSPPGLFLFSGFSDKIKITHNDLVLIPRDLNMLFNQVMNSLLSFRVQGP